MAASFDEYFDAAAKQIEAGAQSVVRFLSQEGQKLEKQIVTLADGSKVVDMWSKEGAHLGKVVYDEWNHIVQSTLGGGIETPVPTIPLPPINIPKPKWPF